MIKIKKDYSSRSLNVCPNVVSGYSTGIAQYLTVITVTECCVCCRPLSIQVAAVREGMASIVPVPLLSLCTARMLETAVCGREEVDLQMLKKVVRY